MSVAPVFTADAKICAAHRKRVSSQFCVPCSYRPFAKRYMPAKGGGVSGESWEWRVVRVMSGESGGWEARYLVVCLGRCSRAGSSDTVGSG